MIGIDEVGRGSWAGPLLAVAAQQHKKLPAGLKDSKLLSKQLRQTLFLQIAASCDIGEGWVTAQEIDRVGLAAAMRLAVRRSLVSLKAVANEQIVMDGPVNYCPKQFIHSLAVIDADATLPIVSAASIYAKVRRDQYMQEAAKQYPQYAFERHVGYGTKDHVAALQKHGVSQLHRLSYKPVRAFV